MENRSLKTKRKEGEKMDGVRLACKYSWNCEKARALSMHKFDVSKLLLDFALGENYHTKITIERILQHLESFEFMEKIAKLSGRKTFDQEVVSFYWRGTPKIINDTTFCHNHTTLFDLLEYNLPIDKIMPELIDKCLIRAAEVIGVGEENITVEYWPVIKKDKLVFSDKPEVKTLKNILLKKTREGDIITTHFETIIEEITLKEAAMLNVITEEALNRFNAHYR